MNKNQADSQVFSQLILETRNLLAEAWKESHLLGLCKILGRCANPKQKQFLLDYMSNHLQNTNYKLAFAQTKDWFDEKELAKMAFLACQEGILSLKNIKRWVDQHIDILNTPPAWMLESSMLRNQPTRSFLEEHDLVTNETSYLLMEGLCFRLWKLQLLPVEKLLRWGSECHISLDRTGWSWIFELEWMIFDSAPYSYKQLDAFVSPHWLLFVSYSYGIPRIWTENS